MTTLVTRLLTWRNGRTVGRDAEGNAYYEERRTAAGARPRRWVIYAKLDDPSAVPPEWHAWLHYTTDAPIATPRQLPWIKPHLPNLTGTALGYRPSGHDYQGGRRAAATGDYEAWTPDEAAGA